MRSSLSVLRSVPAIPRNNCVMPTTRPSTPPATTSHGDVPSFWSPQYPAHAGNAIISAMEMICDANCAATASGGRLSRSGAAMTQPVPLASRDAGCGGIGDRNRPFHSTHARVPATPPACRKTHLFLQTCNQFRGQCSGAPNRCQSCQWSVFSISQSWVVPFPESGNRASIRSVKPGGIYCAHA